MSGWTDERVEVLRNLWQAGLSASCIAQRLGGATRNSVIGKVHRLGLSRDKVAVRTAPSVSRRRPQKAAPAETPPPPSPPKPKPKLKAKLAAPPTITNAHAVPFLHVHSNQCAQIINDDLHNPVCCGAPKALARYAFCAAHAARNFK